MQQLDGPSLPPLSGDVKRIVVLLHGYGSNGNDLISLAPMWQRALADTLFVAPDAPQRCPGAPGGYQWWPLHDFSPAALGQGAASAAPAVDALLDSLLARHGVPAAKLALVGFSQGTMMALHVGPRRADSLAGILGFSGAIAGTGLDAAAVASKPPVMLIHGDADDVVPVIAYHHAHAEFSRAGFEVEGHVAPGLGHGIDMDAIERGGRFLQRVLG